MQDEYCFREPHRIDRSIRAAGIVFHDFQHAGEGIATNVLSDRLARLEAAGIVDRVPDPADARRRVYRLTAKGMDLGPVLVELVLWSARHERTDAPAAVVKAMRRDRERFLAGVRQAWAAQDAPD